ncbi:MAG: tRNA-binding protein [Chitinophagaceae bacterium]
MISWADFEKLDIRVGTISTAAAFPEAIKPAYKLTIDFGETIGTLHSSAQITTLYTIESLVGLQVIAVLNFPPKKIASFISECLVLGIYTEGNEVVLLQPQQKVVNGLKIG